MGDPIDFIAALGVRIVWMEDFDHRVYLVDGLNVALIDHRVPRSDAASCLLELLAAPTPGLDQRDDS